MNYLARLNKLLIKLVLIIISIIRPILGNIGCCRYFPTCTQYAKQALHQFSWHKACWLILKRVLSCW